MLTIRITLLTHMRVMTPLSPVWEVEYGLMQRKQRNFLSSRRKKVVINTKWIEVTVSLELWKQSFSTPNMKIKHKTCHWYVTCTN